MSNLRGMRETLNLSQTALGEMVGCSQGAIGHYESGRRTPSLSMCRKLVSALNLMGKNVKIDDVFPPRSA